MKIQIGSGPHRQEFIWEELEFSPGPGRILGAAMMLCLIGYCLCCFWGAV